VLLTALFSTGYCRKKLFHESSESSGYCLQVCFGPICQVILFSIITVCLGISAFLLVMSSTSWTVAKITNGVCDGPYDYTDSASNTSTSVDVTTFWPSVIQKSEDIFPDMISDNIENYTSVSGQVLCTASSNLYTHSGRCVMSWSWISVAQVLFISKIVFTIVHLKYDLRKETDRADEEERNGGTSTTRRNADQFSSASSGIEMGNTQSQRFNNTNNDDTVQISKSDLLDLQRRAHYTPSNDPSTVTVSRSDLLSLKQKIPTASERKVLKDYEKGKLKRKDSSRTESLKQREMNVMMRENRIAMMKIKQLEESDKLQKQKIASLESAVNSSGGKTRVEHNNNTTHQKSSSFIVDVSDDEDTSHPVVPPSKKPPTLKPIISAMSDDDDDDDDNPPGFTPRNAMLDVPEGLDSPISPKTPMDSR